MLALARALIFATSTLAVLATAVVANGDDGTDARRRTLRRHVFPRPTTDESAFVASTVGFRQGLLLVSAGKVKAFNGLRPYRMAALIESLDGTFALTDWFGLSATGDLQAIVGASDVALYSGASEVAGGGHFGPVVRLLHLERSGTQVTLRPYYQITTGAYVDPRSVVPLLRERITNEVSTFPQTAEEQIRRGIGLEKEVLDSATTTLRRSGFGGRVHVAQGIAPFLGIQLSYGLLEESIRASSYDLVSRKDRNAHLRTVSHRWTAAITIDGSPYRVPFGISFEGVVAAGHVATEDGSRAMKFDTTVLLGPGLYYTGSRSTQIGVFVARELGLSGYSTPYGPTEKPAVTYAQFSFRHFF